MRPTRSFLSFTELSTPVPLDTDARIDAHEGDGADERIVHDLEREAGERRLVVGGALDFIALEIDALDRGNVERRRQIIHHRIEQRLHALVLERRAAHHRHEMKRGRALADAALEIVDATASCLRDRLRGASRPARPPFRRAGCAALSPCRAYSAGISTSSNFAPSCSSCQTSAFILTISTMPLKSASDADGPGR